MNKLFFRFWLTLWVVIVIVVFGSVAVFEYLRARDIERFSDPPLAYLQVMADDLTNELEKGGTPLDWLTQITSDTPSLFLLDSRGNDLLGRSLPPHIAGRFSSGIPRGRRSKHGIEIEFPGAAPMTLVLLKGGVPVRFRWFSVEILIGLGFLIGGVAALGLARYVTSPINQLIVASARITQGEFPTDTATLVGKRRDEIADLALRFDLMSITLENSKELQQNLLRDISHELRSPLARLLLTINLLESAEDGERGKLEHRLRKDLDELTKLVDEIVTLARFDFDVGSPMVSQIDLAEILIPVFDDAQFEANAINRSIVYDFPHRPLIANVDAAQIQRAVENVARNAIRHTREGTVVKVKAFHRSREFVIAIQDEGKGVDESELGEIFSPFYRGTEAREEHAGMGIGLALVKRIVEAHNGHVVASNTPESGLLVEIFLPAAI